MRAVALVAALLVGVILMDIQTPLNAQADSTADGHEVTEGEIEVIDTPLEIPEEVAAFANSHEGVALWNEQPPEVPEPEYLGEPEVLRYLENKYDISPNRAEETLRFEQLDVLRVGDFLYQEFDSSIVTTEVDSENLTFIVYVSSNEAKIRERATNLMGTAGNVEVIAGHLPRDEIQEHWYRLEDALLDAGLSISGGVGPNSIEVFTDDRVLTAQVIERTDLPAQIEVTISKGGPVVDLSHIEPRGGWADRVTYTTGGWCTLGFAATRSDGTAGMVSAGHCAEASGTRVLATNPTYVSSSSCQALRRTLQYFNDSNNPELDAQFVRDEPGSAGNCIGRFFDDVCSAAVFKGEGGGHYQCAALVDLTGWSWTNSIGGTVVGFGSKVAGVNTGTIRNNLYDACGPCSADYVLFDSEKGWGGGDSGGPIRMGSTLQGIFKGTQVGDNRAGIYTKAGWIKAYGMEPFTGGAVGPNGS